MQAAKYISENHTATQTYLERYDKNKKILLEENLARREYKSGSIDLALRLSLEALASRKPDAAAFLLLCGFLDNKDIFWKFLNIAYEFEGPEAPRDETVIFSNDLSSTPFRDLGPSWLDDIARDEATFDSVVKSLYEFSFVRWNEESEGFSIHSIIHEWIATYVDSQTKSQLLMLAANLVAANYGAESEIPGQRLRPHADRCIDLGRSDRGFWAWSFRSLFLLGAFYYDNQELRLSQQLIDCALEKLVSAFGDDSEIITLWFMRSSPIFIHRQSLDTLIENLLLAEAKLTSTLVLSGPQNRVDVGNHLCYAYQMQGNFKKAMEIGESVVEFAASNRVDHIYTCCAVGLLAESYLFSEKYESAKSYANMAILQHKELFGFECRDGSLSAWRRRNMTIMGIACTHLREYELAEVILVSVRIEAIRFDGPDGDFGLHAQKNLMILHEIKTKQNRWAEKQSDGVCPSDEEDRDEKRASKSNLQGLSTDRHIIYLRFDLAMGLFETLGFVDEQIRTRAKG